MNSSLEIRRLTFEPGVPQVLSPPALDVLDPVDHDGAAEDVRKAEDVELKEKKGKTKCQKGTDKTSFQPSRASKKELPTFRQSKRGKITNSILRVYKLHLLQGAPRLRGQLQQGGPLLCQLRLVQGEVELQRLPRLPLLPAREEEVSGLVQRVGHGLAQSVVPVEHAPGGLQHRVQEAVAGGPVPQRAQAGTQALADLKLK